MEVEIVVVPDTSKKCPKCKDFAIAHVSMFIKLIAPPFYVYRYICSCGWPDPIAYHSHYLPPLLQEMAPDRWDWGEHYGEDR